MKGFLSNKKLKSINIRIVSFASRVKISNETHFLYSYFDFFHNNFEALSDEQREKLHQDVRTLEISSIDDVIQVRGVIIISFFKKENISQYKRQNSH